MENYDAYTVEQCAQICDRYAEQLNSVSPADQLRRRTVMNIAMDIRKLAETPPKITLDKMSISGL